MKIYIPWISYHYEGCTEPFGAYSTYEKAAKAKHPWAGGDERGVVEIELDAEPTDP